MVLDEMDTVPVPTSTPPPCKQRAKRESHIGAMGTFRSCNTHQLLLTHSQCSCASVRWGKHVSHFPIEAMGSFRCLLHVPAVVDRSVSHSNASKSQGSTLAAMGT
jgi:hypothetical protein